MRHPISWQQPLISTLVLLLNALLVTAIYLSFTNVTLSPQSQTMLERSASLPAALRPGIWPPGYPLVLLAARQLHWPASTVNLGLLCLTLLLLFTLSRRGLPTLSPVWLPLSYSLCAFNYYNNAQFTAEVLVVPLSLLIVQLLAAYLRQPRAPTLLALSLCCSLVFLSRYHALLWLAPVVVGNLLFPVATPRQGTVSHLTPFAVVAFGPVAAVLVANYHASAYVTGMERFHWASRPLPTAIAYFATSTGVNDNVLLLGKTYILDLFSPFEYATHDANRLAHSPSFAEAIVGSAFLVVVGGLALGLYRYVRRHGTPGETVAAWRHASAVTLFAVECFLAYILMTLLVWSIGNNDPLYTRFLYPSYVFLFIGIFAGCSFLMRQETSNALRLYCRLLMILLLVVNGYKLVVTMSLAK